MQQGLSPVLGLGKRGCPWEQNSSGQAVERETGGQGHESDCATSGLEETPLDSQLGKSCGLWGPQ